MGWEDIIWANFGLSNDNFPIGNDHLIVREQSCMWNYVVHVARI